MRKEKKQEKGKEMKEKKERKKEIKKNRTHGVQTPALITLLRHFPI